MAAEEPAIVEANVIPLINISLGRIWERVEDSAILAALRVVLADENSSAAAGQMWNVLLRTHWVCVLFTVSVPSWQRTHLAAQGTASSRVSGIGSLQFAHKPHCPVPMRRKASVIALSRVASES